MRTVLMLARAFLRQHPTRLFLTALAILVAACMVVWVVSGYDRLIGQFATFSQESFGRYTLTIIPTRPEAGATGLPRSAEERFVPPELVDKLRAEPAVLAADPMWAQRALVMPYDPEIFQEMHSPATTAPAQARPKAATTAAPVASGVSAAAPGRPRRRAGVALVGTDAPEPPFPILRGRWIDPATPLAREAVLSADAAERLGVDLGDTVSAGIREHAQKLVVIGITDTPVVPGEGRARPAVSGPAAGGLYVPMKLAEFILDKPSQISFVAISLRPEADVTRFRFGWAPRLNQSSPPVEFQNSNELEHALNHSATADNLRMQAYAATGISLLAALFIIFTTLNMGVSERARQFAILRAVALTRWQVAALIGIEAIALAILGWIGGVVAGYGLLWTIGKLHAALGESGGVAIGRWSLALSAICAFGGALCAAIVPAIRAMRLRPLDAMAPRPAANPRRPLALMSLIGLFLIAINPLLAFVIPVSDATRYIVYSTVGCTSMAIGFVLLAPIAVLVTERICSPILTTMLGLERRLLSGQLTGNLWRTVGTSVAMTVGLGLFVTMQVWGYTMLRPFEPGEWVPSALVAFLPEGLPGGSLDQVRQLPGLDPATVLPLAVEQPKLAQDLTDSADHATVTRQDNVVMVGFDADQGLGGEHPLLKFHWVEGSPPQAIALLKSGRGCIVPDHFIWETGLKLGDSFALNPPADNSRTLRYTIAGVVHLPGWHWVTKLSGLRLRSARTAALVFADYDTVAKDFPHDKTRFYWANGKDVVDPAPLAVAAQKLAESADERAYQVLNDGLPLFDRGARIRVTTPQEVGRRIRGRADGWIWSLSELPLITLAVSAIGLLNAMFASVRARTWDLGVLRAIGFTRWAIVRAVIAEAILIGMVACVLSLGFGILAGWCGAGISQYVSFFGGLHPGLTVPWIRLSVGVGGALALCVLAAAWPALAVGRTEPLRLLQAGRGGNG